MQQDPLIFSDTVRANLCLDETSDSTEGISDESLWDACRIAQIGDTLRSFPDGLETVIGSEGRTLSAGEKQRLELARVLLRRGVEDWRADGRVRWQFQPLSRCVGPQSGSLCHVSSPRLVKPGAPISGTGLSCLLHVKGYAAYRVGSAFGVAHGLRTR